MLYAGLASSSMRSNLFSKSTNCLLFFLQPANQRGPLPISSRNLCVKSNNNTTNVESKRPHLEPNTDTTFKEFYRFTAIRVGFALHKLKWYHTLAAGVAVPSSALLYFAGITSADFFWSVSLPALLLGCNLYGWSEIFHRAIGFAYLSEDGKNVKFSYLDFWGERVDEIRPVTEVVPLLDAARPISNTFGILRTISFYSTEKNLKMYLRFGTITDMERFTLVFGPIE